MNPATPQYWVDRLAKAHRKGHHAWRKAYAEYLQSGVWKRRRHEVILRAGGHCLLCQSTQRLEVHHVNYERVGDENPEDLRVLCHPCHVAQHSPVTAKNFIRMDRDSRAIAEARLTQKPADAPPPPEMRPRRRPAEGRKPDPDGNPESLAAPPTPPIPATRS